MNKEIYLKIENYMKENCGESVHDEDHIYRVLYNALDIAEHEKGENINFDVLIAACLLHDIGRVQELNDKSVDHAERGSEMASDWLLSNGFDEDFTERVCHCIRTHRYRGNNIPSSIEAKILFDADKMDVAGFVGIARTLMYSSIINRPIYNKENNIILDGTDKGKSFFGEYIFKLSKVYDKFFTGRAKEVTAKMKKDAQYFYETLYGELNELYKNGEVNLNSHIED